MFGKIPPELIRKRILEMAFHGQTAHAACALSIVEILTSLYSAILGTDDLFVLSKGHGAMALYAVLGEIGLIPQFDLDNYFKDGSRLHGLAEAGTPGIHVTAGSLGHGLPIAVGMALAKRRSGETGRVYCLVGDGEIQSGPNWEALMFAAQQKLGNLTLIVDANDFQAMNPTHEIDPLNLKRRLEAFGCSTHLADGHSEPVLIDRLMRTTHTQVAAVIAKTVKGHGVTFMENSNEWHYKRIDQAHFDQAMSEVRRA